MTSDKARAALYAYATVAFREDGVPALVHNHVTQMLDDYRDEARANQQAEAAFGVVFDRPDADRSFAWGPFAAFDTAARFAEFVAAEIDPAHVIPWQDAVTLPGVRVADPVAELLGWRTAVAMSDSDTCPTECPCHTIPLQARWDNAVIHPESGDTEDTDTIVCCVVEGGQPVAVMLDDDQREALGLALLLPDGDGEVDPQHLELARENERLRAQVAEMRGWVTEAATICRDHDTSPVKRLAELTEMFNG